MYFFVLLKLFSSVYFFLFSKTFIRNKQNMLYKSEEKILILYATVVFGCDGRGLCKYFTYLFS